MNESLYYPFGPFLWKTKLDQKIVDELLARGNRCTKDANEKLAGHIEKEKNYEKLDQEWFVRVVNDHFAQYLEDGKEFFRHELADKKFKLHLESLWINYMVQNEYNPEHVHGGFLSFVIYLQIPRNLRKENSLNKTTSGGAGSIDFSYGEPQRNVKTSQNIFPEVGDLIIFPSLLRHFVYPFRSDGTRISVSGNFSLQFHD